MRIDSNVTQTETRTRALFWGAVGVLGFSFTLPATKVAVTDLDPSIVGLGRALVAAACAAGFLLARGDHLLPPRALVRRLAIVALGVVIGFPLFSALALQELGVAHSAVIVGGLPAATAVVAVTRAGERPSGGFWAASAAGLVTALAFAAAQGAGGVSWADGLVLLAVAAAAFGYAEGGALARDHGGARVICWALVMSAPVLTPIVIARAVASGLSAGPRAWLGFAYVSVVSMFLAFFAWYRGLALGGIAKVSQLQLAQPLLTLGWSVILLSERVDGATVVAAIAVLASVAATQRARVQRARTPRTSGSGGRWWRGRTF